MFPHHRRNQQIKKIGKILYISTALSQNAGGIQGSLRGFTNHLFFLKQNIELWSLKEKKFNPKTANYSCSIKLFDSYPFPGMRITPKILHELSSANHDLLHLHGMWTFFSIAALNWKKNKPKVISPHGMLNPWAFNYKKWKKKIALTLFENLNLRSCSCFHALSESEYKSIRSLGYRQPVAIIPNGIELPKLNKQSPKNKKLLYVGRMHEIKNLAKTLSAWNDLPLNLRKNWSLHLYGWGDKAYIGKLKQELGPDSFLHDPVYGQKKEEVFKNASGFILPSLSEALPVAVLEAWSYRLPVLMTKECSLPEGFKARAAVEMGTSQESIKLSLTHFLRMSDAQRQKMGYNGRKLVKEQFNWPLVASKMHSVYQWLLGNAPKPKCVMD